MGSECTGYSPLVFPPDHRRRYSSRRYLDQRSWKQRLTRTHKNWEPALPFLVELYMGWKYAPDAARPTSPMVVDPLPTTTPPSNYDFVLEVLDVYTLDMTVTIACSGEELPIHALAKSGYLGNSPATPSLAISFRTLELFRRLRLRKSSFSVEAFVKVVCDIYSVCLLS